MPSTFASFTAVLFFASTVAAEVCHLYSSTIESPCFTLLRNESGYEVREYRGEEMWTSAYVRSPSFAQAQNKGFMANFDYISGENSEGEKIPMTAPVTFRSAPDDQVGWLVSFFVPSKYPSREEVPAPKDESISIMSLGPATYAVRVFDGFATFGDFDKNEYELKKALLADGVTPVEDAENGVIWAGYDSPFVYVNRHNEVWVRVA
ncbi:hypothetical protein NSK_002011 [Nannochloropsis salina CCMP1776]|uniref:Uncharacterized protein n=1 Tax=Nannochloropsis salina CCMP1776 TaxID=1027361 RepID=A0A4D9DA66_9STRA|nr:hypothetical protein NSK_002011 [Nannochloropsis salina CCMP1776]|eukprot:TFJ86923.1 hypothetical protein NSK_002011 [Nannochloropsis salina CCMP1776]